MGRFLRDLGLLVCVLLLPVGIYCLHAATDNSGSNSPLYLLGGAALASGGLFGLWVCVREHFVMRDHVRYAQGKSGRKAPHRVVRP